MTDPPSLRVSDEQRERAAREIREHFAAGRLNEDELSTRLSAVYAARTSGELEAVRTDLPPLPVSVKEQQVELRERRAHLTRRLIQQTGAGLAPFVICSVIWLSAGATGSFWPIWILLVVVLPLFRNGWQLYGPAPELDRVERHLSRQERQQRHSRHRHRGRERDRRP